MTAEIKVCENCQFWSDQIARVKNGNLQAICLSEDSRYTMDYTGALQTCGKWTYAEHGAIDDPDHGLWVSLSDKRVAHERPG